MRPTPKRPDANELAPMGWGRRDVAVAAAIALAAALFPYYRAFQFGFALDDYTYLMQAAGFDPAPFSVRRWLAVRGYYEAMLKLAGARPEIWHGVAFALHAALAVWVGAWARRFGASRDAAWIAVGLFAASPLAFMVLYWIACVQELGSGLFLFAAAWLMPRRDRARWGAVPLFALAVLCKESVLAAPLALAFLFGLRTWRVAALMLAVGAALFIASGLHARMFASDPSLPYSTDYGITMLVHLASQIVWTAALWRPYPDRIASPQPNLVLPALLVVAALTAVVFATRGAARRPLVRAGVWYVALLLPVLPLSHHAYAYYGYLPQIGFVILAAVAIERVALRLAAAPAPRLAAAAAAVAVVVLLAARNARTHETLMLPNSTVPHDSIIRSGRAAGAVIAAVRAAKLPAEVRRVVFTSAPEGLGAGTPTPGSRNPAPGMVRIRKFPLREALRDGDLVALHFPGMTAAWAETLGVRDEASDTALFFTSGFNRIMKLEDLAQGYLMQGQGRLLAEDYAGAHRDLQRVLELDPHRAPARTLLAGLEIVAGRTAEARALIAEVDSSDVPAELQPFFGALRRRLAPAATRPAPP
jgi:hypothetical protein